MTYKFSAKNGEQIEVAEEKWGWKAVFKDGASLRQFGEDGIYHQSSEVDWTKIEKVVFYKLAEPARKITIGMKGQTFIAGKRNFILDNGKEKITVNYIQSGALFVFALPDDRIFVSKRDEDILKIIKDG